MAQSVPNGTKAGKKDEKPRAALRDASLRRIRALQMVQQRVQSVPREQVAQNFGVTAETVDNEMKWARTSGLLEAAEDRFLGALMTKAQNVIEAHLDEANLDAAKEVVKVFIHANQQKSRREEKQADRDFDLDEYFREKRAGSIEVEAIPVAEEHPAGAVLQGLLGPAPDSVSQGAESQDREGPVEDSDLPDGAAQD